MKMVRIFKNNDGIVRTTFPWHLYDEKKETKKQFMDRLSIEHNGFCSDWKELDFIDLNIEDDIEIEDNNGKILEQYYFDGECKKENLKIDEGWNKCLMPQFLIHKKHNKKLNSKIDDILSSDNPDQILLYKYHREKEKIKSYKESDWYLKALENLDARVAGGESDKPIIREKLLEKINQLKEEKGE